MSVIVKSVHIRLVQYITPHTFCKIHNTHISLRSTLYVTLSSK